MASSPLTSILLFCFSICIASSFCPAGYQCLEGKELTKCEPGMYSPPREVTCIQCPPGHYCRQFSFQPTPCKAGTYAPQTGLWYASLTPRQCIVCPVGHACPYGSINPEPCKPPKYFSHKEGAGQCSECPRGAKCIKPHKKPEKCPPGQHNSDGGCKPCPPGYACLPVVQKCPPGTYSVEGHTVCLECPRGKKRPHSLGHSCQSPGEEPKKCAPGFTSQRGHQDCSPCPAGHHCPTSYIEPIPCAPRVSYSGPGATECSKCPANHSCPDPSLEPVPCPQGAEPTPQGSGFCGNAFTKKENSIYSGDRSTRSLQQCAGANQYYNPVTNQCVACNPGQECINGYYYLRACLPGTYNDGSGLKCEVCPTGSYCSKTTVTPCAPGTFSLHGWTECLVCPAGYKCQNTIASSIKFCGLEWGRYSGPGSTECSLCPPNHFCNDQFAEPCLEGQFSILGDANCHWCPAGMSCNPDGTVTECPEGYYSPNKQKQCLECPENHMCPSRGSPPVMCPFNTEAAAGSTSCSLCPPKHYSVHGGPCTPVQYGWYQIHEPFFVPLMALFGRYSDGQQELECEKGYLCYSEQGSPTPDTFCPPGFYCDLRGQPAFVDTILCPVGTYQPTESNARYPQDCLQCPAGHHCIPATQEAQVCPNGFYCPRGTAYYADFPCPEGTYTQSPGATSLNDCQNQFCPQGQTCIGGFKLDCPPGYYCTGGVKTPCEIGFFQPYPRMSKKEDCIACLQGYYCPGETDEGAGMYPIPCPPGKFTTQENSSAIEDCQECSRTNSICPRGGTPYVDDRFYCPPGHSCDGHYNPLQFKCPPDTYYDLSDAIFQSDCLPCPPHYKCPQGSSFLNQNRPYLCPRGSYCDGQTYLCPAGTYNPTVGAQSISYCLPCPPGFICPEGSGTQLQRCAPGFYCPHGTTPTTQIPCPPGTFSALQYKGNSYWPESKRGARFLSECFAMHPGTFQIDQECPVNTYNPFFFVPGGQCINSPPGFSTEGNTGAWYPSPCPIGTYSRQNSNCEPCLPNYLCDEIALSESVLLAQKVCPAGYYCEAERIYECPVGYFCEQGTGKQKCPEGQWSLSVRSSSCKPVPAGYWHDIANHKIELCPRGHFCLQGQSSGIINPCPKGTFNSQLGGSTASFCQGCVAGYECPLQGMAEPQECSKGNYCPHNSEVGTPCPFGTFNPSLGLRKVEHCQDCYIGHFCGQVGIADYPPACQAGYFCERNEVVPAPDEKTCPDNRYCPGDNIPSNCPPGTWVIGSVDNTLSTHCESCPPGKYCWGAVDPQDCAKGHYCTGGSQSPYQHIAQINQFVPTPGSSDKLNCPDDEFVFEPGMDFCFSCTPGFFCYNNNAVICSAYGGSLNNYCVSGNIGSCPDGTINTHPFADSSDYCLPCLSGRKCQFSNLPFTSFVTAHNLGRGYDLGYYGWDGRTQLSVPSGHFTDPPFPSFAFPCPAGTKLDTNVRVGIQSCRVLPQSQFSLGGAIYGLKCQEGYDCSSLKSYTQQCPPGYRCSGGIKTLCHNGMYQAQVGQTICLACPIGNFCPPNVPVSVPTLCAPGTYCEKNSGQQTLCPISTYNNKQGMWSSQHCLLCPPGKICSTQGVINPLSCPEGYYCSIGVGNSPEACTPGTYCPPQADFPIPCDPGKVCDKALMVSANVDCRGGNYCQGGSETGVECPIGAYCPTGSAFPRKCPAGTINPYSKKLAESNCLPCNPGTYCDEDGLASNKGFCYPGFYCEAGSPSKYQHQCQVGHKCVNGLSQKCTGGDSYQPRPQASECIPCPKGHVCSNEAKTICDYSGPSDLNRYCFQGATHDCPAGKIIYFSGAYDMSHCVSCPPGSYCPNRIGKEKVIACNGGFLCEWQSIEQSEFCPAGYYCPEGERAKECPSGSYCTQGREAPNALCDAGYYCLGKSSTATELECPPGSYCPEGTDFPIGCPPGTFSNVALLTRQVECTLCTPAQHCKGRGLTAPQQLCEQGYYCPESSVTQYEYVCPRGHYCPAHQYEPKPCSVNNYQSSQGSSSCILCPERYQCVGEGLEAPSLCQAGSYCRAASLPLGCPVGSYSPVPGLASSQQCMPCPRGYYCQGVGLGEPTGPCYGGYICSGSSKIANPTQISGYECPIGYYCEAGSPKEVPCPPGTYALSGGLSAVDQCQKCPAGHYCPKFAMLADEIEDPDQFPCGHGYICTGGAKTPYPTLEGGKECSMGKYCEPGATQEQDCPPGQYNPYTGRNSCFPCPRGYKCPDPGMTQALNCGAGFVCTAGTSSPQQCPPGTYSLQENLYLDVQCTPCLPGYYCQGGKSIPDGMCQAGYVCYLGSSIPYSPDTIFDKQNPTNGLCPKGHYCTAGTKIPTPCPLGKFQDETGQTQCKPCPEGKYCDSIMLSDVDSIKNCADRYYCIEGASVFKPIDNVSGRLCEPGFYCKNGLQVPCPPGTYEPRKGSKECQICPAGYFCTQGTMQPTICPELGYCPEGSGEMIVCPDGTYNSNTGLQDQSQCVPCKTGHYCQGGKDQGECEKGYFCYTGSASPTPDDTDDDNKNYSNGPCPLGHYCLKGATYPKVCSDGRIRATVGATEDADCEVCPAGYYCIKGNPVGIPCPKGMYCPTTSPAQPVECPLNTYNEQLQQDEEEDCLTCKNFSTHFCNSRRITKKSAYECPPGHFCIRSEVLTSPQLCIRGTYQANRGAANSCEDCPPGSYCMEGQIVPSLCTPGSICPEKSVDMYHCPPGKYCTEGDSEGKACPEAFYCPEKTEIPIKCPHGTYCEPGMQQPIRCPPGKVASYNPHNINEELGCVKCDKGTYTDQFSTNLECQPCEAGYVCLKECKKQFPTIKEQHNGYRCPPGFYCPAGSYQELPCPKGTYSPHFGSKTIGQCYPCDYNTYSFLVGQNGCRPCGPTATSELGAHTCTCKGRHRVFHQSSGTCSCETGYQEPLRDVSDDTKFDCVIESRDQCPDDQVMDEFSRCSFLTDCEASCGKQGGIRYDTFGLCVCNYVTDVEQVCDEICISSAPKIEIASSSSARVPHTNGTVSQVDIFKSNTVKGRMACPLGGCFLYSILYDTEGSLAASYHPHELFERSLQTTGSQYTAPLTAISSPIICIQTGDTLIFEVDIAPQDRYLSNYPIYIRESTLNSDSQFDATPFLTLQDQVLNSNEPITHFVYQFNAEGLFLFASSQQLRRYMVVRVLHQQMCPDEQYYIQPLTPENLFAVGVHRQIYKPVHPAWGKVMSALLFFILCASLTFWGIAYSHAKFIAAQKEALLQGKKEVIHQRSFCYSLFGRQCCLRKRAQINPAPENPKRPASAPLSQDSFYSSKIFDIKRLIQDLKGEGIDLTLQDICRIKSTAQKLDREIDTFFLRKEASYKELLKRSKVLNERFTRISQMNDLIQKEEEEDEEEGMNFHLDNQRSDIDQQEMKEFVHNFEREGDSSDESRVIKIQPRIDSLIDALKTEVHKRTAACEMEVAQRQQRTIERTKKELDLYLRSSYCVFSEREQRNIRGELEATLAQLRSLIQQETKEVEMYLHSKIYEEQEIGLRVVQTRIDDEMGRKSDLYSQYLRLVQVLRERALAELRDLQKPKKLKQHLFKEVEDQLAEEKEKFKKEQLEALQKGMQEKKNVEEMLKEFDLQEKEQRQLLDYEEEQKKDYIQDNLEDLRATKTKERVLKYKMEKAQLKQDKDIRLMEIDKEILYYSEMLTNKYQDSRIESINALAEQERRIASFELQRQYARELQRLETEEFQKIAEVTGKLRLLGMPQPVDSMLLKELSALKQKREKLCDDIVNGLDVGQKMGGEYIRMESQDSVDDMEEKSITLFRTTEEMEVEVGDLDIQIHKLEKEVNLARAQQFQRCLERKALTTEKLKIRAESTSRKLAKLEHLGVDEIQDRQDVIQAQLEEHLEIAENELLDNEDLTYTSQRMIDFKQGAEMAHVLTVLVNERAEYLKIVLIQLFADKLDELQQLKEEFKPRFQEIEYEPKGFKELSGEEQERKKDIDIKYFELIRQHEERTEQEFTVKHQQRLIQLREDMYHQKNETLKKYITKRERKLKEMEFERREKVLRLIQVFKKKIKRSQKEREYAKRQEEEEVKTYLKKALVRQRSLDLDQIHRERRALMNWKEQKRRLQDEKREMLKQILHNPTLEEPKRRELIREYRRNLIRTERAVADERSRQAEELAQKLKDRKHSKDEQRLQREQKLALYRLQQDKILMKQLGEVLLGFEDDFDHMIQRYDESMKMFEKLRFPGRMEIFPSRHVRRDSTSPHKARTPMSLFFSSSRFNQGTVPSTFSKALKWLEQERERPERARSEQEVLVEVNARLDKIEDLLREDDQINSSGRVQREADKIEEENDMISFSSAFDYD